MRKVSALLLLTLTLFCACQEKEKKGQLTPEEIARKDSLALKLALMPTLDCLPFYYAEEQGIYDSLGLDLRIKTYQAQMDCDTAFSGNTVQVSYTDLIRATLLQQKRTGLHVIMATNGNYQLIVSDTNQVTPLTFIKGKMIGLARHSATDFLSDYLTTKAQIDTTDIFRPQINALSIRTQMLENATLDAAFLPEPYATEAQLHDCCKSIYNTSTDSIFLNAVMVRHEVLHDSNRNAQIKKLIAGYNTAVLQLNKQIQDNTIGNFRQLLQISRQVADSIKFTPYKKCELPQQRQIQTAIKWLKSRQLIPADYEDTLCITTYTNQ